MAIQLGGYRPNSLQWHSCSHCFQSVWTQSAADVNVKQAVTSLQTLDIDFHHIKIQALVPWWYKYLNVIAAYMEVWCVPSATHVPCIHWLHLAIIVTLLFSTPLYNANIYIKSVITSITVLYSCQLSTFVTYCISRPIRRTMIFSLEILEKNNDECILILVIYWKKTGIVTYQN